MCKLCLGGSCWCNGCVAIRDKACPVCHHFRVFYSLSKSRKGGVRVID